MRQWFVLYRKEQLEMWRSGKWIWVPAVSILLCVMQPISVYYMPQILNMAGGLPEGTVIEIPIPDAPAVLVETMAQFGIMGLLVLVLACMGIVATERSSGTAAMIMVKPVSYVSFIAAKWSAVMTLAGLSLLAGYASAWYYTALLIGNVDAGRSLAALAVFGLWIALILTATLLLSTWIKGSGAVAFAALFLAAGLSIATSLLSRYMIWSPAHLTGHAGAILIDGKPMENFTGGMIITLLLISVMIYLAIRIFRRQELPE